MPAAIGKFVRCTCQFVATGQPMNQAGCEVHTQSTYACLIKKCTCDDYRPTHAPKEFGMGRSWSRCSCGHMSDEHFNKSLIALPREGR